MVLAATCLQHASPACECSLFHSSAHFTASAGFDLLSLSLPSFSFLLLSCPLLCLCSDSTPKSQEEMCNATIGYVLEELTVVSTRMVDCLLTRLLHKDDAPRAHEAAVAVLKRAEGKLAMPIAQALLQYMRLAEAAEESRGSKRGGSASSSSSSGAGGGAGAGAGAGKKAAGKAKSGKQASRKRGDDDDGSEDDEEEEDEELDGAAAEAAALLAEANGGFASGASSPSSKAMLAAVAGSPFIKPEVLGSVMIATASVIPSTMLTLVPALERELGREDAVPRAFAVQVLGQLFALPLAVQATEASLTGATLLLLLLLLLILSLPPVHLIFALLVPQLPLFAIMFHVRAFSPSDCCLLFDHMQAGRAWAAPTAPPSTAGWTASGTARPSSAATCAR